MKTFYLVLALLICSTAFPQDLKVGRSHTSHGTFNVGDGDSCMALIQTLENDFAVHSPFVGAIGTIDVDAFIPGTTPSFHDSWHARLRRRSGYRNVQCEVFFPYISGSVKDTADAVKRIGRYYDLTMSVPWIRKLIERDTSINVTIKYVAGVSLSTKAQASFLTTLAKHSWRAEGIIQELLTQFSHVAFFDLKEEAGKYSRWIVLPSLESILWHYSGFSVLDLDLSPFQETGDVGQRNVFVRFSPDGQIVGAP